MQITRSTARQVRAVLRKIARKSPISTPVVSFLGDAEGLHVRLVEYHAAVEYHLPGPQPPETLHLHLDALADFEGRKDTPVTLDAAPSGRITARWDDGGVPRVVEYDPPDAGKVRAFPEVPKEFHPMGVRFLPAMDAAVHTTTRDANRYAINCIQLRGDEGKIIATDSHQLYLEEGFTFPWREHLLIPALDIFDIAPQVSETEVAIGRTDKDVGIRIGAWTILLAIDTAGKFPVVEDVIPRPGSKATRCRLTRSDAAFLARTLPRLPGKTDPSSPITVDLNGHVAFRVLPEGQTRQTEVILSGSQVEGPPLRFHTDRDFLARALALQFSEWQVQEAGAAVVCRDERRLYLWMPLKGEGMPARKNAIRIVSGEVSPAPLSSQERSPIPMSTVSTNGHRNGHPSRRLVPKADSTSNNGSNVSTNGASNGPIPANRLAGNAGDTASNGVCHGGLIAEATALRESLRDAFTKSNRLVAVIKRQRKQSKLMATTLASLRQLEQVEA